MFKELYTNKFISATNVIMNAMSALRPHFRMQTMQPVWLLILPSKTFEDTLKNEEFQAICGGPGWQGDAQCGRCVIKGVGKFGA